MASIEQVEGRRNIVELYTAGEPRFISYKWEEFVTKLSALDDPALRDFGLKELENLNLQLHKMC